MRLTQLQLNNFRGATDISIDLHGQLNVFFSVNGAGKTTILDALAIGLSWLANRIRTKTAYGRSIQELDIQYNKSQCSLKLSGNSGETPFHIHLIKPRRGHATYSEQSILCISHLTDYFHQGLAAKTLHTIPVLYYYPVNRAVSDIPVHINTKHKFRIIDAIDYSLGENANFRTFFEWFRNREDIENALYKTKAKTNSTSRRSRTIDRSEYQDAQLETVRKAIYAFIPGFSDLTVRRNPLRMEVTKNDKKFRIEQLSNGEKCLMAMVGDIARRLVIANPNSKTPLKGEGIVLIDEIDLHLHPAWQHMIIPQLTKTFPNCQFLISTHSPLVITHVPPEQLFFLSNAGGELKAEHPRESYGKNADRILEDLMDMPTTRPAAVEKQLKKIFNFISNNKLEEAKKTIKKLMESIGDDAELVRARTLIQLKKPVGTKHT